MTNPNAELIAKTRELTAAVGHLIAVRLDSRGDNPATEARAWDRLVLARDAAEDAAFATEETTR